MDIFKCPMSKIFCTNQLGENVLNLEHWPNELLCEFVQGSIINKQGTTMMGANQQD